MTFLLRRTLSSHLRIGTIYNVSNLQAAFTLHPRMTMSSQQIATEKGRSFPTSGFKAIESNLLIEEEELPDYRADRFYPVHLGDIFQKRYQVVAKLGFGTSSTTWLARDLKDRLYVALKVCVSTSLVHRELPFYNHIGVCMASSTHRGRSNIRRLMDSFEIVGEHGKHTTLVFEAAQMSLRDMKLVFRPEGFDEDFVRGAIIELLEALDFLHTQGEVVHTDIHPGNMLLGLYDNDLMQKLEEKEFTSPVPRKAVSSTRTIYLSRLMRPKEGPMLLSDFGEARIGPGPHGGDIMPLEYRAPETLLYIGWSYPVDIWSVGLTAWDLLESKRLFTARDEDGDLYDAAHLSQLIATLGPPPPEFLARNPRRRADFWDEQGNWLGLAPIPKLRTMEALETRLQDKSGFLRFIRRALTWMPEKRATAKELLQDPWLTAGEHKA
ncbi:kinase-like domain-containing protein [Aspergillus pseudonomiae]|uniref:non-specific serine/threonine protein kinase n=1 Tax=Aspergillus pseudonomiae TaxID=1506151 RepID=A0A5N6IHR1_9EURO|nr:kinase-like domain-containing protein [Aspergillus pseudonomiae]KAB8265975.1 kinase-like domain-containing protein [Aspergillus pseudonomiae]KAE8400564.1 kinase-like domain-containing protein [Aspergillus pseudonomiae]